jgi:predicted transcriptional regulator
MTTTRLTQFCSEQVLSTHPQVAVNELAAALLELGLDGVPVCQGGALKGMVTYSDIVKTLLKKSSLTTNA